MTDPRTVLADLVAATDEWNVAKKPSDVERAWDKLRDCEKAARAVLAQPSAPTVGWVNPAPHAAQQPNPSATVTVKIGGVQPPAPLLTDEEMPPLPKPTFRTHPLNPADAYSEGQVEQYGRAVEAAVRRRLGVQP